MKFRLFILLVLAVNFCFPQQTHYVDFKRAKVSKLMVDTDSKGIGGNMVYELEILKDIDSIYLDAQNIELKEIQLLEARPHVHVEYANLKYLNNSKQIIVYNKFKKGQVFELHLNYSALPKKALYFIDWDYENGNKQIWTQGQGKYTSNWLPSIDDMNDKIEFDLSIRFDKDYEVIANGNLTNKQFNDSTITWHYDMQKPMSSYLVALAIGKYDKKVEYSKSGIPLEMYYYPEDSLKLEPTYRYTKQMFDFLEEEIGVPYPWQNYKMVPVKDFLYAGMENTTLNLYSDSFVVDSIAFVDKNFVNINAHELAHQWFGDLVTEVSGTHHWLQEGFATYYALLAEKDVFGEDYYYWRLYEYAQELLEQDKAGQSTSLLNPKSSSTTFYKKGAWVLHMLRNNVGDKAFREAVKNYLIKHQFKNVETDDFISEVEKASGQHLDDFVAVWLKDDSFNYSKCYDVLKKESRVISNLDALENELLFSSHAPDVTINRFYDIAKYFEIKRLIFSKNLMKLVEGYSIYKKGFNSKDLKVRQAIAQNLTDIPLNLKADYESLLNDKSYITIEAALFNLWRNFPKDREKYLNQTKGVVGFSDKNVEMLWLTLALITEDYEVESKKQYFNELVDYTASKYGFEVRQNAFQYLNQIQACNDICKENLIQASNHHNWRFKKFAKSLLERL
ncbi:M1 family metallopeptidase [Seonamhaeicola sediminis]|uniref:Aminopeptidase N n=1 Tax=Seonamhaeicola sediminis TaxID=2528206 RepID=A0A562YE81_9FLAO|nr:M1 family metallopeptidase [Seonamhaeicola sediminis]TWO32957.1 M1 family metallopeptidase [Seonamhaeicola sediminis]